MHVLFASSFQPNRNSQQKIVKYKYMQRFLHSTKWQVILFTNLYHHITVLKSGTEIEVTSIDLLIALVKELDLHSNSNQIKPKLRYPGCLTTNDAVDVSSLIKHRNLSGGHLS